MVSDESLTPSHAAAYFKIYIYTYILARFTENVFPEEHSEMMPHLVPFGTKIKLNTCDICGNA